MTMNLMILLNPPFRAGQFRLKLVKYEVSDYVHKVFPGAVIGVVKINE